MARGQDASWPIQVAVFDRLAGTITGDVYDSVPPDAAFPYSTVGDDTAVDASTKDVEGEEVTVTIHVWSRPTEANGSGRQEVKTIMGEIQAAMFASPLTVAGWTVRTLNLDFRETILDPDGKTYHGIVRYRLVVDVAQAA